MVAPRQSSLIGSAYPKRQHLTKDEADVLYVSVTAGLSVVLVLKGHGPPDDGVTGVGISPAGSFYQDLDSANTLYLNTGDIVATVWHGLSLV